MGHSEPYRSAYLIEDVDESQGICIISLQRHRCIHTHLRCQHLGEKVWELPGSYVDGHKLDQESILESWDAGCSVRSDS